MGKKGSNKKAPFAISGPQVSVTIREASAGKKHTNAKSSLKLQHIKNLAVWASRDAAISSLGAFFGHHFAASSEALGTPVDPSLSICQRCESILHPGYNCTIRIEKNKKNARRKGKKSTSYPQNNIVYTCHFCSHQNMKRGTPRNTSQTQVKAYPKSTNQKPANTASSSNITRDNVVANIIASPLGPTADDPDISKMDIVEDTDKLEGRTDSAASGLATPLTKPPLTLLESKMKRNRSGSKKRVTSESTSEASNAENLINTPKKRRRKSWTSLKEIAECNEKDNSKRLMNLTVPFSMM